VKKSTSKKVKKRFTPLSPHYEEYTSSQEIKSRFHAQRNRAKRNLDLEGSFKEVEEGMESVISTTAKKFNMMSQDQRISSQNESITSNESLEYTVHFDPGSIGLKIEPIIKNGKKEFGCKVMSFVDSGSPSQARKTGRVQIGHVLTAVNGANVTAKTYKEIVSLLAESKAEGKDITFRIPRSLTKMPKTPKSALSKTFTTATPFTGKSSIFNQNETAGPGSSKTPPTMFSPSFVKKMSRTTVKDNHIIPLSTRKPMKSIVEVLTNVIKNIAPDDDNTNLSTNSGILSKRIGETLTGSHSAKVNETVQMKMYLLRELNEAKASLGQHEKTMKKMETIVGTLEKENLMIQSEKQATESTLSDVQKAKVSFRFNLKHNCIRFLSSKSISLFYFYRKSQILLSKSSKEKFSKPIIEFKKQQ